MNNQDYRICDKCNSFTVSPDGCSESCFVNLNEPVYLTNYYYEQRVNGIVHNCKGYKKMDLL